MNLSAKPFAFAVNEGRWGVGLFPSPGDPRRVVIGLMDREQIEKLSGFTEAVSLDVHGARHLHAGLGVWLEEQATKIALADLEDEELLAELARRLA